MEKMLPRRRARLLIRNTSGQGMLEFILMLVIVVGVVGGTVYQFNTAFGSFMESYFTDYLGCLLETGELPTLGSSNGVSSGICDAEFAPFNIANGRPPNPGGQDGEGSSSSRSTRPRAVPTGNRGRRSRVTSSGSTPNAESGGSSGSPARQKVQKQAQSAKVGGGYGPDGQRSNIRRQSQRSQTIRVSGSLLRPRGVNGQEASRSIKTNKSRLEGDSLRRKVIKKVDLGKKKVPAAAIEAGMNLSNYLRWAIMILLVLFLLFIFGFQAMQVKKGWDVEN